MAPISNEAFLRSSSRLAGEFATGVLLKPHLTSVVYIWQQINCIVEANWLLVNVSGGE